MYQKYLILFVKILGFSIGRNLQLFVLEFDYSFFVSCLRYLEQFLDRVFIGNDIRKVEGWFLFVESMNQECLSSKPHSMVHYCMISNIWRFLSIYAHFMHYTCRLTSKGSSTSFSTQSQSPKSSRLRFLLKPRPKVHSSSSKPLLWWHMIRNFQFQVSNPWQLCRFAVIALNQLAIEQLQLI